MKNYLIASLGHWFKSAADFLRDLCIAGITQSQSLPAFPDIEWELHGHRNNYHDRIRTLARFFFLLGCLILGIAMGIYLWQSVALINS